MPQPTETFINKVETNRRRLRRLGGNYHIINKRVGYCADKDDYRKAKIAHSLLHNMIEGYKNHGRTQAGRAILKDMHQDILTYL